MNLFSCVVYMSEMSYVNLNLSIFLKYLKSIAQP